MKEDRVENVYDLTSRIGDPFKNALFADLNEPYITSSKSHNFLDPKSEFAEYLQSEFEDPFVIGR